MAAAARAAVAGEAAAVAALPAVKSAAAVVKTTVETGTAARTVNIPTNR